MRMTLTYTLSFEISETITFIIIVDESKSEKFFQLNVHELSNIYITSLEDGQFYCFLRNGKNFCLQNKHENILKYIQTRKAFFLKIVFINYISNFIIFLKSIYSKI